MNRAHSKPAVFLVQVSEQGSTNILKNGRYRNEDWQVRSKDHAHGQVKQGDLLLVYFAGGAIDYRKQLKTVFRVNEVLDANKEFRLELFQELNPIPLDRIREMVSQKILSNAFLNCGRQGFNICRIDFSEYQKVIQISEKLPPTPPAVGAESLVEDFIVNNWRPSDFFGEDYSNLEILTDRQGNVIGQQYDTKSVGIIDLLCKDKGTNEYVVIEIKRGPETSDQAVGQLARYMGWVKKNLAGDKRVSGIAITGGHDEKLLYAISSIPNCHVAIYELDLRVKMVDIV